MIGEMIACFCFGLFAGALVGYIWNTIPIETINYIMEGATNG